MSDTTTTTTERAELDDRQARLEELEAELNVRVAEAEESTAARLEELDDEPAGDDEARHLPATTDDAGVMSLVGQRNRSSVTMLEFVPKALRGRAPAVLACILTGHELGIGPMQSLAHIHIIEGKATQSAELMRALILKAGHRFAVRKKSNDEVIVWGRRHDTGDDLEITWSMDDAKRAGVAGKDVWKNYPRAMLMARATSELARDLFADVLGGVSYTPDELGAEVYVDPYDGSTGIIDVDDVPEAAGEDGPMGWAAAADYVENLRPPAVAAKLRDLGLDAAGRVPDLKARLTEALATGGGAGEAPDVVDDQADDDLRARNASLRARLSFIDPEHAEGLRAWWQAEGIASIAKHDLPDRDLNRVADKLEAEGWAPRAPGEEESGPQDPPHEPETAVEGSAATSDTPTPPAATEAHRAPPADDPDGDGDDVAPALVCAGCGVTDAEADGGVATGPDGALLCRACEPF
jgi:hypothetical protein